MKAAKLRPGRPPAPQADLLGQAAVLEAFLARQKKAGQATAARTDWQVHQQALAQEAAESEAQVLACWQASPAVAAALLSAGSREVGSAADSLTQALSAADSGVAEAISLAAAVSGLLQANQGAAATNSRAALAGLQQRVAAAQARLQAWTQAVDASAAALLQGSHPGQGRRTTAGSSSDGCTSSTPGNSAGLEEQLQSLAAQHPLASASCKAQLAQQAAELEARRAQQAQQRRAALRAFLASAGARGRQGSARASSCSEAAESSDLAGCWAADEDGEGLGAFGEVSGPCSAAASGTPDGWSADEQAVFVHARSACLAPGGGGERALVKQLAALLPARSAEEVQRHEKWHKEAARLSSAARQQAAGWQQEVAAFLTAAAALLAEAEAGTLAAAEAAVDQLDTAVACWRCAACLEDGQAEREQQEREAALEQAVAAARAASQRFESSQQREDYRSRLKELVAEHRKKQEEQHAAAEAAERAAAAAAAEAAAAASAAGRQRVAHRREQGEARQAARRQEEARRQAQQAQREASLAALAAQVAPNVPRDADRATGHTQASASQAGGVQRQHGVFAAALSFTNDQLMADQRFKVFEALRQLGLHQMAAGRQAVAAARPARPLRADTLTCGERQLLRGGPGLGGR